jgi:hypothetical protein
MNSIITVLASAVSIFGISMQGFAQSLGSREDEIAIRAVIVASIIMMTARRSPRTANSA